MTMPQGLRTRLSALALATLGLACSTSHASGGILTRSWQTACQSEADPWSVLELGGAYLVAIRPERVADSLFGPEPKPEPGARRRPEPNTFLAMAVSVEKVQNCGPRPRGRCDSLVRSSTARASMIAADSVGATREVEG